MSVTSSDDVSDHQLTASPVLTPLPRQPLESRDSSDAGYHAVVGLLLCSSVLVVVALTVYLCSVVRHHRHFGRRRGPEPADDVTDRVTSPTAVTSLSSSARSKEVEDIGVNKSLLGTETVGGGGDEVTWYGSRDVEVGRPMNVRYVSIRRCARQSSSVESETGVMTTPTSQGSKRQTPQQPKRFGFVGWTGIAAAPPGECTRHEGSAEAATSSVSEDCSQKLTVSVNDAARYVV